MRLTLLGHAAFYIETSGLRIVTDPYSPSIGYAPVDMEADFVTLSHDNPQWHSCLDDINGSYKLIQGLELTETTVEHEPLTFGAVKVFEKLPDDGQNAMVWFESEGIRVLHMGDCGHLPTDEQIEAMGDVQVLLALAGGPPTIELPDLVKFVEKLQPKAVIPMHYQVPKLQMEAQPLSDLVELWPWEVRKHQGSTVDTAQIEFGPNPVLHTITPLRQLKMKG